jgi:hypothetical protein
MNTSKRWTYKQVTQSAEGELRRLAALARRESHDRAMVHVYSTMANGVVALWRGLTMGWQTSEDAARLDALALGVRQDCQGPTGDAP